MEDKITLTNVFDEKITEAVEFSYPESVIPIGNPVLSLYYAYSAELEQKMSRMSTSNIEIPFYDYVVRRTVLESGLTNYDLNLLQGPKLPKFIIFTLSDLERLNGTDDKSLTKFVQGDLEMFDLILGKIYIFILS